MADDDLARELVNVAYDPRIADDRVRLEETPRAVVEVGGCERVSLLAWALLSACAKARAKSGVPIASGPWPPAASLRRRVR
jgi:hypothetical protein